MMRRLIVLCAIPLLLAASTTDRDAHQYSDAVLFPRFSAALNEYAIGHGTLDAVGHLERLNAADLRRWTAVRDAWRELDGAMKRAGY